MINTVFGNSMENVRKHRNIKPVVIESRRKYLVPNYHSTNRKNRNEKNEILTNKHVYLGLSILELRKILMYEFWYDYVKPKLF